jgi:general secretion pathway protein G
MKRYRIKRRRREGFTLMELLIVLGILVMLIALAAPRLLGTRKKANIKTAQSQIGLLRGALEHYALDMNDFPASEEGLRALDEPPAEADADSGSEAGGGAADGWGGPYLNKELGKDPWGNDYQYAYPPERGSRDFPDIWSWGPDGEDNTEDDICSWSSGGGGESSGSSNSSDSLMDVDVGSNPGPGSSGDEF